MSAEPSDELRDYLAMLNGDETGATADETEDGYAAVAPPPVPRPLPRPRTAFHTMQVLGEHGEWVDAGFEGAVQFEVLSQRVRAEARRRFRAETEPSEPFDAGTLADILARSPEPQPRIEGLMPWQAGLLLIATRKTGKTTFSLGLCRSLITGEDFLGVKKVRAIDSASMVGYLNFEVSGSTFARWAKEAGIPVNRMFVVNLRGKRNPFSNDADLARLGALLRENRVETLVIDVFARAFDGSDQNDNSQVGAWFNRLDEWARGVVGGLDVIVTAHAGKSGEGFRGASTAEGWTDAIVELTREGSSPTAPRYLSVEGRDVSMDKTKLDYDLATRAFKIAGSRYDDTLDRIVRLLTDANAPMGTNAIEKAMDGTDGRDLVRAALNYGESTGRLGWNSGRNRSKAWFVNTSFVVADADGDDDD